MFEISGFYQQFQEKKSANLDFYQNLLKGSILVIFLEKSQF